MLNNIREFLGTFFNKGHERTVLAKKNIVASFGIKGITMLTSFLLVPLTLSYINSERYGIYITLNSMIMFLCFFDIGFGTGLKNKLTEALAKKEWITAKKYVSSTYAMLCIILVLLCIAFIIINPFLDWCRMLNADTRYQNEINQLILICFLSFSAIFVLRLLTSVLFADQRPALASFIDMLGQVLTLVGTFILTKTTAPSLVYLGLVMACSPALVLIIASIVFYQGKYKFLRPSIKYVDISLGKKLVHLGVKFFIPGFSALFISQSTNFILTNITNPTEVSNYNTAFRIFAVGYSVMNIIISPYWSSFTDAYVHRDFSWMKSTINKLQYVFLFFVIGQAIVLLLSDWLYAIWIKDLLTIPFIMSLGVCMVSLVQCWINTYIFPLNGIGKIKLQMYSAIAEMVLYFPVAYFLGSYLGAVGVIFAAVVVNIPRMIWAPVQLNRIMNQKATGIWNQ